MKRSRSEFKKDGSLKAVSQEQPDHPSVSTRPSTNDGDETSLLTPHTRRLLKLILEGTAEHASEASVHLTSIAAHQSSPKQLWEILGLLQEGLTSSSWKTRSQAADALQGVARQLPVTDQVGFLQGRELDGDDLEGERAHYLTVLDLVAAGALNKVLAQGRTLMATSSVRYDIEEEEELKGLDQSALGNEDVRTEFVQRRVRLQRRILSQRLGLAVISEVLGEQNALPQSITTADLMNDKAAGSPEAKKQRHANRVQEKTAGQTTSKMEDALSVRALLVMEMEKQERTSGGSISSHRNPQELLATELVYRMFDPAWHVRHGALLGTLSLLRAWKTYASDSFTNLFGVWPHDVLARCLCILALDRFGDFSGALVSSRLNSSSSSSASGGVVAPIREVAGQLISVLFVMAPRSEQVAALDVLVRLCEYSEEWEPRHGALATLKFILVVLRTSCSSGDGADGDWKKDVGERVLRVAICRLCDKSDDVKSAAALVVTEYIRGSRDLPPFVLEAFPSILHSIITARSFSSCLIDLVELLAEFLRIDSHSVVGCLSSPNSFSLGIGDLPWTLCRLLHSDFQSVRCSVLHSISAFVGLFCQNLGEEESQGETSFFFPKAAEVCRKFVEIIFEWYFYFPEDGDNGSSSILRDEVWKELAILCTRLRKHDSTEMDRLEVNLLLRYFWTGEDLLSRSTNVPIYSRASSALATFLTADKQGATCRSLIAVASLLKSPWIYHCEASCLLHKAICSEAENFAGLDLVKDSLTSLSQEGPLCLLVEQVGAFGRMTRNGSVRDVCKQAFYGTLSFSITVSQNPDDEVKKITSAWISALQSEGIVLPEVPATSTSVLAMRVNASIAGAIVASGLPTKITPVVRALMTSLQNESASQTRQTHTCTDLSLLLKQLQGREDFAAAQRKVLNKICDLAVSQGDSDSSQGSASVHGLASTVLSLVCGDISSGDGLMAMEPLWSRISGLCSHREHDSRFVGATKLLCILVSGLKEDGPLVCFVIDKFTQALVKASCEVDSTIQHEASATLTALSTLNPTQLLLRALPLLIKLVDLSNDDSLRLAACILLKDIIDKSGTAACEFVRVLLPAVMSLMTDRSRECSLHANSIFAALVQIAPLVSRTSKSPFKIPGSDPRGESVIDHLIFGLPLPPYVLPEKVSQELKAGGIELRAYQIEGISWLRFLQTVKLNGALCDSMGLGKTLQALCAVAIAHCDCPNKDDAASESASPISLVVCPASVVGHWVREIKKYFPGQGVFSSLLYVGSSAVRASMRTNGMSPFNIVVTSYSVLRSDIDFLESFQWRCCVLDEGHLLKNPRTGTARAAKRLNALHKTILSGTPCSGKVNEIWAIFDFLMPNFLGTPSEFSKEYARPITKGQETDASASAVKEGMTKLKVLHQQVLPFMLRREKEQVLRELPPKNISIVSVPLSDLQRRVYDDFCATAEARKSLTALESSLADTGSVGNIGSDVLKSILFLRLLCTHPSLILARKNRAVTERSECWFDFRTSGKLIALVQLLTEAGIHEDTLMAADNDSSLLYCDEKESSSDDLSEAISLKGDTLLLEGADLGVCRRPVSKCLIFSQFTATLDIVEELVFKPRMPSLRYMRLDGQVPSEKRAEMAETFNRDPSVSVMLLTTRVGGLGLNLTGADTVIFLEFDWNPYADLQAMDRAHRLGQNKTVNVYRIVTENTIEERILEIQERKVATSEAIVNSDNSTMYQMGTDRLLDILSCKSTKESGGEGLESYDLDALLERFAEDYTSLSVGDFSSSLTS